MADAPVVHIGENSPEYIAYRLMERVASVENVATAGGVRDRKIADREWILNTYAECLQTVRGYREFD